MSDKKIAFIGTGNMSYAIIGGMVKNGFSPSQIIATNRNQTKLDKAKADFNVITTTDNLAAMLDADIIILSVKPQMMEALCQSFSPILEQLQDKLFISVAAGITIKRLQEMMGFNANIVRCMPNTPSLLGKGVSGLFAKTLTAEDSDLIERIFSTTGIVTWVEQESQINDIIAVTGSSPAYFFLFMEAMEEKAKALGFSEQQARELVQQTALGAAEMAFSNHDISLAQLRANVTSKGGTTHAAIEHFKAQGLKHIVADSMSACIHRAEEMEKEI